MGIPKTTISSYGRLDFQPFCESAFLPCDWSVLPLVYPTWWMSVLTPEFLSSTKCVLECIHMDKFRETQQDAILNFVKGKDVLVS